MATQPVNPTPLPTPPSTSDPANFDPRADAFLGALQGFQTQTNDLAQVTYDNAVEAAQSATTSTTSKNTAVQAAQDAVTAKNAAIAAKDTAVQARDDMQKLYLGIKPSNPATDNTGQPVVAGAWYTNSTDNYWYWYNGTEWIRGVGDPATVDWATQVLNKPNTVAGYGITNAVRTDFEMGNVDLNSAEAMQTGFFRYASVTNGPLGFNIPYGQLIVSAVSDTVAQTIWDYNNNQAWYRVGSDVTIVSKSWIPIGNHPLKYVDDNSGYMYGNENGGLNMVNVFRASGNIAKYLPKYPVDGDRCTIVIANSRADNTVYPAAGSGHTIMGLAEPMTIDNISATVTFIYSATGYGWRIA